MNTETINDFFEEPIDKEIEDEVNTQVVVIDYCVAFGKWLCGRFISVGRDEWQGVYKDKKIYSTSQLFHKFLDEYEHRRLA